MIAGTELTAAVPLGPLSVAVTGDDGLVRALSAELGGGSPRHAQPSGNRGGGDRGGGADLTLSLARGGRGPAGGTRMAQRSRFPLDHVVWSAGAGPTLELRPKLGPALYRCRLHGPLDSAPPWHAEIHLPLPGALTRALLDPLLIAATRDATGVHAVLAKHLVDELLDPLAWLLLLRRGATMVHAGSVVRGDGGGILLWGAGGVGKSTTVLELVTRHGCRFLADDRAVLTDGRILAHPKRLRLQGQHTALVPGGQQAVLAGRADVATWRLRRSLLGARRVGRRVDPLRLFGPERVAGSAPLAAAVVLTAGTGPASAPKVAAVSTEEMTRRGASMVCNQFWDFLRFVGLLTAGQPAAGPSLAEVHEQTSAAIRSNLGDVPLYVVTIPPGASPEQVSEAVLRAVG